MRDTGGISGQGETLQRSEERMGGCSIKFGTSCANIERPHFVCGPSESEHPAAEINIAPLNELQPIPEDMFQECYNGTEFMQNRKDWVKS
ncbi:hypothetical protein [Falsibacillus albus]|uniref:Uncharacterized protein n=1 Tax=Falsibacillus albus TaxID=2478915 RepID=A0A3L7JV02_9BACI|nr:hypothetical protein [Falsibacillus albus]RLQ94074.1 hypothetical protein D9X91_15710 [Falsibacillus albus]